MLGYGIDPRPGVAYKGLQERILSAQKLPFMQFTGGYASHIGLSPAQFAAASGIEAKSVSMHERVVSPLFKLSSGSGKGAPLYVYFNVDESSHLKRVLEAPKDYAPAGIYIMRIHGTFVNFLDLSPSIQKDIIERLDEQAHTA